MMFNFVFLKSRPSPLLVAAFLGFLVAGCSDRSSDVTNHQNASCKTPAPPVKLPAMIYDPATKLGWSVNGPSFPEQKKNVPMGKFDNQIVLERSVESDVTSLEIKLQIFGTVTTGGIILDTVWYAGAKEIGREAPSIEIGQSLSNILNTIQTVPLGADRLILIARPWRKVDGILTVGDGQIVWCKK